MEETKGGAGDGGAGDGGAGDGGAGDGSKPGTELTREQVMAQRAEKKKLKEARKNKSAGAPPPAGGSGDNEGVTRKPKQPQVAKKQEPGGPGKPKKLQSDTTATVSDPQKAVQKQHQQQAARPQIQKGQQKSQQVPQPPSAPDVEQLLKPKRPPETTATSATPETSLATVPSIPAVPTHSSTPERSTATAPKYIFESTIQSLFKLKAVRVKDKNYKLHPIFHKLGVKLIHNVIRGTNLRCAKLLHAVKDYVQEYETPVGSTFKHTLADDFQLNMDTLRRRCPFAIGMNNAVDFLSAYFIAMEQETNDVNTLKEEIMDTIDQYIEEKIEKGVEAIILYAVQKIAPGDILMIYSITDALLDLLVRASDQDIAYELILVQTPETMLDIPNILEKLAGPIKKQDVRISMVSFSNAIYRMRHCTKLLVGGHGLFTTGGVMAQSGSGELALLASTFNKPAIFLCETYKFCDRSPLDFFTLDEYVPEHAVTEEGIFAPKIKYDVTPANLVTVVITDIDVLPSTSVPVVLRVQESRAPKTYGDHDNSGSIVSEPSPQKYAARMY